MDAFGSTMFFELCRLCLKNPGVNKVSSNESLLRDIFNCTGIKISARDNLPQNLCHSCMEIVRKCKELRELAAQNDFNLRMLFGETSETQEKVNIPETTKIQENITIQTQDKPKLISVRTDLFEKPSNSNKEEPKYEKKRKKQKTSHSSKEEKSNNIHIKEKSNNDHIKEKSNKNHVIVNVKEKSNKNHIKDKTKLNISDSERSITNKESNDDSSVVKDDEKNVKWKISGVKTEIEDKLMCNICSKKFDTTKKLYLHKRQHDKKILCPIDVCGKRFTNKSELDRHVRTHTGEKPFSCDICDKRFAQNVTLKQHKDTVHAVLS